MYENFLYCGLSNFVIFYLLFFVFYFYKKKDGYKKKIYIYKAPKAIKKFHL